ncbi:MAG: hypothetical protein K1X53_13240 [Candidatus Sumerlaeaceae bacterium]|nr:hypothetical protein [Candidatus Sumerlaeaceae bacterium]
MYWNNSTIDSLRHLFREGFKARDIAEPLASLDASTPAAEALSLMQAQHFDVVGIRCNGQVAGFLEHGSPATGVCGDHMQPIDEARVVPEGAPLADTILALDDSPRLFVRLLGGIAGIITLDDLQKPPVRMWLFGMVTLTEMRMHLLIDLMCPNDSWRQYVSEGRLKKAEELLEERRRRNQNPGLLHCLQFPDKMGIIARNEAIRSLTRFTSRRQVEDASKALESLRNNLAHSQDIVSGDWKTIVQLSADLDNLIKSTGQIREVVNGHKPTPGT